MSQWVEKRPIGWSGGREARFGDLDEYKRDVIHRELQICINQEAPGVVRSQRRFGRRAARKESAICREMSRVLKSGQGFHHMKKKPPWVSEAGENVTKGLKEINQTSRHHCIGIGFFAMDK
ncbi:hypothetical protein GOP47_0021230 [Adiantum capillus-veneris]|uniref:Uncharacterized protein n=1 Tax=Adiantum capillus-veneris TaxID=13818 RepID=A0A9D4UCA0_ADICA|nr:hypothetical protein GOP47_0021229 [Adiantum capillus-veneris]KAI5064560.1 hypothetical protein GOP47_0021230 [Adiantum capillus-veneris]